jgi:PAS domain S-box-containing protein
VTNLGWTLEEIEDLYNTACGCHSLDENGVFVRINKTELKWLGYQWRELRGKKLTELLTPASRKIFETNFPRLESERSLHDLELAFFRRDGTILSVVMNAIMFRDKQHNRIMSSSILFDITDRKRIEDRLRESEERFRVALKNSPVVVFNQDLRLRYTWINSPVLAWAEQDYIGRTDMDILGGPEGEQLMAIKKAVLENGVGTRTEPIVTFNGEKHYYDLTVEPLRDSTGAIQGVTCSATDITPMKRAAAERESMIEELAQAQRELMERNRELGALHDEKTRWLGMANHDLRNPLSGILANCELLIEDAAMFSEDHRAAIKSIYSASQFMLELLNDVLDISAIESGKQEFRLELTDVRSVIEDSVDLCRPLALRKGTELVVNKGPTPIIVMDRRKIQQVLSNLIGNAIKFSQNYARVQITVVAQPDSILITVRDNGPGIPPDELGSVFTAFHATPARVAKPKERGTGLGLAICKRILERHGGKIWAESTLGKGTAFNLSLPL